MTKLGGLSLEQSMWYICCIWRLIIWFWRNCAIHSIDDDGVDGGVGGKETTNTQTYVHR